MCSHVKRQNRAAEVYDSLRWGWWRANPQNSAISQFKWIDGLQVHWEFVSKSKVKWLRKTPDVDLRPGHMHAYTHTTISTKRVCTHEYTHRSTQNKPGKPGWVGSQRCSSFVQWKFDFTISKCFSSKVNHENGDWARKGKQSYLGKNHCWTISETIICKRYFRIITRLVWKTLSLKDY